MIGYEALRDHLAAVGLRRDFISVRGPDATSYLQGQLSQDIEPLAPGGSALSLLLEPQGRISAFVRVTRLDDEAYLIDSEAGTGPDALARLRRFKLRTKVDLDGVSDWRCVGVRGPDAPSRPEPGWYMGGTEVVASFGWPGIGGVDLIGPDPAVPSGVPTADVDAFEVRRIECALPASGSELDERTIPAEAGLITATVSFTKGCYTGQELVARIDSRGGNVPRRLRIVAAGAEALSIPAGAELVNEDQAPVGVVTSIVHHPAGGQVGLAFVKRGFSQAVHADARWDGGTASVALQSPPSS